MSTDELSVLQERIRGHEALSEERHTVLLKAVTDLKDMITEVQNSQWKNRIALAVMCSSGGAGAMEVLGWFR